MRAFQLSALIGLSLAAAAHGSTLNFSGTLQHDDQLVVFQYSVQNQGQVTVQTTSFANGGFIPVLSLFDAAGVYVFGFDGYANNSDAALSWVSDAGADYTVILSEYDNYPLGNLSDGFSEAGQGDYTTVVTGFPGPFRDPSGAQLTGDWAVTFTSADPTLAVTVPEPGTMSLLICGVLLAVCRLWRGAHAPTN